MKRLTMDELRETLIDLLVENTKMFKAKLSLTAKEYPGIPGKMVELNVALELTDIISRSIASLRLKFAEQSGDDHLLYGAEIGVPGIAIGKMKDKFWLSSNRYYGYPEELLQLETAITLANIPVHDFAQLVKRDMEKVARTVEGRND